MRTTRWVTLILVFGSLVACGLSAKVLTPTKEGSSPEGSTATTLPKDIYPDSMGRLPLIKRDQLDENGKQVWDRMVARGNGQFKNGFTGPWNMRMYSPRVNEETYDLRYYLGHETKTLGSSLAELVILVAAREVSGVGNVFEFTNHEPGTAKLGLSQQVVDIVKYRKPPVGIDEKQACIIQYGRELIGPTPVTPETFAHARKLFGDQGVAELTELLGQYVAMAMVNKAFDMHNSPQQEAVRASVAKAFGHD